MRTISDNLKYSLAKKTPVYTKKIELYRRVWGGSSYSYDSAEDITDELLSVGNIFWKLDNENYGAFNLDNVGVTFRNDRNQWKQDNTKGHFTGNYILNQSKIVISVGAQIADGTFETTNSFIGYVYGDVVYNQDEKTVNITLISGMSLLNTTSVLDLTTTYTQEVLGCNEGTTFETRYKGVAEIVKVEKRETLLDKNYFDS